MTKKELEKINNRYLYAGDTTHTIEDQDVKKINQWIELIESSRNSLIPQPGDIVRLTNEHGDYYPMAHIDSINDNKAEICENAYTPFVHTKKDGTFGCSASGGAWCSIPINELKLVDKQEKAFCDWGNCGACAHGAIDFIANVNVWEYKAENRYGEYTTKDYNKMYISINENKKDSNYIIFGDGIAWESWGDYYNYKKIHKAHEFAGNWENQRVIFTYKEIKKLIDRKEWEKLGGYITTELFNGTDVPTKIIYDDKNKIMTSYRFTNYYDFDKEQKYEARHD